MIYVPIIAVAAIALGLLAWFLIRRRKRDRPILSIVLMRSTPRRLTEAEARGIFRRAFNSEVEMITSPLPDGHANSFAVLLPNLPPMAIFDSHIPYWGPDESEADFHQFEHPKAREAYRSHTGWCAVDLVGEYPTDEKLREMILLMLARIAAELHDEGVTLLMLRDTGALALPDERTEEMLKSGQLAELFADDSLRQPLIHVSADDKKINAAMAEARTRIPELISAFDRLGPNADPPVMFKARFVTSEQNHEYSWCRMTDRESTHLVGINENVATSPGVPQQGETVRVALDDVVDWAYFLPNGKAQGFFVERIINPGVKNVLAE
ncbi:MAG: hypothetical protein IBJ18_05870 [Phycisphaerales bacterium]|nr:hypothetical protein [Phycisphaerales bacterium]